jgi:diacylglycerol kinase
MRTVDVDQPDDPTPASPKLDTSVIGTMKINPKPYKPVYKTGFVARTKYAVSGFLFLLRREKSFRILLSVTTLVAVLGVWLRVELVHAVLLLIVMGMVWAVESLNSAVEAVVDLVTHEIHPMAKVAKDVAASATFIASLTAATTTLVLLGPPLLDKFGVT